VVVVSIVVSELSSDVQAEMLSIAAAPIPISAKLLRVRFAIVSFPSVRAVLEPRR